MPWMFNRFDDWGKWPGEYDDEVYEGLKAKVESGDNFDTGWHGWREECQSMRIIKANDEVLVMCSQEMDEARDLIFDITTEEEDRVLEADEHLVDEIEDELLSSPCFSSYMEHDTALPLNATLDQILEAVGTTMEKCDDDLEDAFRVAIETVLRRIHKGSPSVEHIINERIQVLAPYRKGE